MQPVWVTALLLTTIALSGLLLSEKAVAGTYAVHTCKTPGGSAADISWERDTRYSSGYFRDNECPEGSFTFGLSSSKTHAADDRIIRRFKAPSGTEIGAYSLSRSAQFADHYNLWFSERTASGSRVGDYVEICKGAEDCNSLGDPDTPFASENLVRASGLSGVGRLQITLTCGYGANSDSRCSDTSPAATYNLHRADITLRDDHAPKLAEPPTGPLLEEDGALIGNQQVWVAASDRGGGVAEVLFEVDGEIADRATIDDNNGRCVRPFSENRPCKTEVEGAVSFDTTRIPDGRHRLRLLVTDATGSNAAPWGEVGIRTANGTCNPRPRLEERKVRARFAGSRKRGSRVSKRGRVRLTHYGKRLRVRGRATTQDGEPLADAELCVAARNQAKGASLRKLRTVSTNAKGRFSFRLPRGPSRRVHVVSRTSQGAAAARLRVKVRAPVGLRASQKRLRNGDRVALRGRLRGRPRRRGVLVEVQARRETGWQTFGTARTNRKGRFRFPYRFTRTTGVQRYKLRARVPRQRTYPFATGASRPVKVRVAG